MSAGSLAKPPGRTEGCNSPQAQEQYCGHDKQAVQQLTDKIVIEQAQEEGRGLALGLQSLQNLQSYEDGWCSSAVLLCATAQPSGPNVRYAQTCARGLIFWSQKGRRAGAGEGIQAHVLADAGTLQRLWRVELSEFRRRTSIPAPKWIMIARRECP